MKKLILSVFAFVIMSLLMVNCSTESENDSNSDGANKSFKEKIIGFVNLNNDFVVYNDSIKDIKIQWEKDYSTTITSFNIISKTTITDPSDSTSPGGEMYYMLIGNTANGSSIAMSIAEPRSGSFTIGGPSLTVTCSGCTVGCRVESFRDKRDKNKLKYMCVLPCPSCSKTETLTDAPR